MTTQTKAADPLREAFERWFTRNDPTPEMARRAVRRDANGYYVLMQAHTAWETWRAAYAQARADLIAELRPVAVCLETSQGLHHSFAPVGLAPDTERTARRMNQQFCRLAIIPEK